MDPAEKIPQCVHLEKKPHVAVEADIQGHSTTQAVAVTKVLDDDNPLREIIVRVGFPTTLVRAALVCKRWLAHASDPKFLSRFRELHPPRLLGFYMIVESTSYDEQDATHFVPIRPQPPELAAVIRRLERYDFGTLRIKQCQNGTVFTGHYQETRWTHQVHHPMCPETRAQIFPPFPDMPDHNYFIGIFSKEEGNNMSYLYLFGKATEETGKFKTRVYMLQNGEWLMRARASSTHGLRLYPIGVQFGHNKTYFPSISGDDIVVLDLMTSSYSTIQLPQGVTHSYLECMLSLADDASSVYLINVKGF